MKKNAERLKKVNIRALDLAKLFEHFTFNSWIYETNNIYKMIEKMTPEDRIEFKFDVKEIDWPFAIKLYVYGL